MNSKRFYRIEFLPAKHDWKAQNKDGSILTQAPEPVLLSVIFPLNQPQKRYMYMYMSATSS